MFLTRCFLIIFVLLLMAILQEGGLEEGKNLDSFGLEAERGHFVLPCMITRCPFLMSSIFAYTFHDNWWQYAPDLKFLTYPFVQNRQPIPHESYDKLKKLGIPPPPEGRYMTRYQVAHRIFSSSILLCSVEGKVLAIAMKDILALFLIFHHDIYPFFKVKTHCQIDTKYYHKFPTIFHWE